MGFVAVETHIVSLSMIRAGFLFLFAFVFVHPLGAQEARKRQKDSSKETALPGKVYVYKESAGKPRQMEIYFPPQHDPKTAKVPGMILFHGGGWSGGSLSQFRTACAYFASRGLVCATAEYQMLSAAEAKKLPAGETKKRVCVTDAKSAIRWFKQHASELGIDPSRIITGGGSAGGHISALATMNDGLNDPKDPLDVDTKVVAYLWFNPAFATDDVQDPEIDILKHLRAEMPQPLFSSVTEITGKWVGTKRMRNGNHLVPRRLICALLRANPTGSLIKILGNLLRS